MFEKIVLMRAAQALQQISFIQGELRRDFGRAAPARDASASAQSSRARSSQPQKEQEESGEEVSAP